MRRSTLFALAVVVVALAGCGGGTTLLRPSEPSVGVHAKTKQAAQRLGFPTVATKNTTRVGGGDAIVNAAAVALAVFPSAAPGTHPQAVTLAPSGSWQAALASASLMAPPLRSPILLSDRSSLPTASGDALKALAPTGSGAAGGFQLIRVGNVAKPGGYHATSISGNDPFSIAAAIDRYESAANGKTSDTVVIASADNPAFAMPAAGWAAESGQPILFVDSSGVPGPTSQALLAHQNPKIYVLGPTSVIPDSVLNQLRKYGTVKRVGGPDAVSNAVALATYRDPPCVAKQPCGHIPGSFGWAMRSPGHGYILVNSAQPLDAAGAAPLSGSGDYGPILLVDDPNKLPKPVLDFFLNYATPGFSQYGPTAAVYNHGWVIGDEKAISIPVQAELDSLLEVVPQGK
ncbi:MAG: cell wall-binding repeat-containing protein [Solirubrobacteraceae bacterium]